MRRIQIPRRSYGLQARRSGPARALFLPRVRPSRIRHPLEVSMPSVRFLLLAVVLFIIASATPAEEERGCYAGAGEQSVRIPGFNIRVFRHARAPQQDFLGQFESKIKYRC